MYSNAVCGKENGFLSSESKANHISSVVEKDNQKTPHSSTEVMDLLCSQSLSLVTTATHVFFPDQKRTDSHMSETSPKAQA